MEKKARILVVDDEPINLEIITETLEERYEVFCVYSGQQCIDEINQIKPDLVLMDIVMPGMNGYETCEVLKKNPDMRHIPIIFVSALNAVDDRLKAYHLQAVDYISKPFDLSELMSKVKINIDAKLEHDNLIGEIENMTDVVHTTMAMSSESGIVSHFIENSFLANNYQELADRLFEALQDFGLHGALQISQGDEILDFNPDGEYKPLESELIGIVRPKGRIFEFDSRLFINFASVSILVKNMPRCEQDKLERFRDHLVVIGGAADARINALNAQIELKKHINNHEIFKGIKVAVEHLQQHYNQDRMQTLSITQTMGQNIEERLLFLGLDEDQESALLGIIDESAKQLMAVFNNENLVADTFSDLLLLMKSLNQNQSESVSK